MSDGQWLDAPDSPGLWGWEGYINYTKPLPVPVTHREIVRVYWGSITNQFFGQRKRGIHPVSMMIGKWYQLAMEGVA